jgi:erythromycin esterase-like protein
MTQTRRALVFSLLLLACSSNQQPAPEITIAEHAHHLTGAPNEYDPLLAAIGSAHLVLLGEATHGTHEFYAERAEITMRLIREKRFTAVALEADWADAARVDRYVRGTSDDRNAIEALGNFDRFPRWMWRNREFAELVEQIRRHNDALPAGAIKTGVYGLDLYEPDESRVAVDRHLRAIDPAFAEQIKKQPIAKWVDLIRAREGQVKNQAMLDELFSAEQNARVVANGSRETSWNERDRHMVVTMQALQRYLIQRNGHDNIVVWAHNSHVGDARATGRAQYGEWNMGQLVREHWPRGASFTVGFFTHSGTVMAASEWGGQPRVQNLQTSIRGSHGAIFHATGLPRFYVILSEVETRAVRTPRLQRAVGVIYLPANEYQAHYYTATLREQFDAAIHIDATKAVTPLD